MSRECIKMSNTELNNHSRSHGHHYSIDHISVGHLGQLSLLPSAGWEMSTGQSAVMFCSWGVKAGWLIPLADKRVGGR